MLPLLGGCLGGGDGLPAGQEFEGGAKYVFDYVPTLKLSGSWQQMGRQYGRLLAEGIAATYQLLAPYKDRPNLGFGGRLNSDLMEELYQSYPPRFKDFFQGMAQTSGLTLEQLKLANAIEIVMMFGAGVYASRCSALSSWGDYSPGGRLVYGRNYDYAEELLPLNDHIAVTVFLPDNGDLPFAICTWAGCIYASTGINQKGLYAEENDCSPHDQQAAGLDLSGGNTNMKVWVKDDAMLLSMLAQCSSIAEADGWMRSNLPNYPHNIGIADKSEARCYQWNIAARLPHAPYARQGDGLMAQTNHYFSVPDGWDLAPAMKQTDNGSGIPGASIERLDNLLGLAGRFKGSIDVARMCDIMDVQLADGGATVAGTLFQIVCEPATFTFKLKTQAKADRWVNIPLAALLFS